MIAMAFVGALVGTGVLALVWRLMPRRVSPLVALGRFDAAQRASAGQSSQQRVAVASSSAAAGLAGIGERLGARLAQELTRRGVGHTTLRQDLTLTGRTFESALVRKLVAFLAGFALVVATAVAVQAAAGVSLPAGTPVVAALLVGAGFWFLPDLEARAEATARRRDFRRALGAYLDLVALEMAGSAAPAEALPNAARVGAGWPMALLRDTLWRATLSGRDPWDALTDLGARIGVGELRDLGQLVALVGRDGATVRATLTARAATMRRRELADTQGQAGQRDQSMLLAQILIGFGFIVFITYPAVIAVLAF